MPSLGLSNFKMMVFFLSYYILFYCYHLETCCFLMRARKVVDMDGKGYMEELREVDGVKITFKLYCLREKKTMFSVREKIKKKIK